MYCMYLSLYVWYDAVFSVAIPIGYAAANFAHPQGSSSNRIRPTPTSSSDQGCIQSHTSAWRHHQTSKLHDTGKDRFHSYNALNLVSVFQPVRTLQGATGM